MSGLTWLHFSDWHQKGPDFDRRVVRDALLNDLRDRALIHPALAEVDFVVFSGDAAWAGKAEEYTAAREGFFDPMLNILKEGGLPPSKLFIVPGNHDLSRGYIAEMLPPGLQKPLETDAEVQKWLTDSDKRDRALEPFKDYTAFVTGYTGQSPAAYANASVQFIGDIRVGILCLNSAWMCGRNKDPQGEVNDYGFLTVGEPQLHDALTAIQGADVRIGVVHHPFDWLRAFDRNHIEKRLKQACHFILRGHEHQPDFNLETGLYGRCAIIPAGACYDRRVADNPRYTNAYNFVHLDFDAGQGVIHLRRWSEGQTRWIADTDAHDGGRFDFPLPRELSRSKKAAKPQVVPEQPSSTGATITPAVAAYLQRLENLTSKLALIGLGKELQLELPIEQAYIPLNVVVTRGPRTEGWGKFSPESIPERERVEENVLLGDIFKWAARFDSHAVVLLGDPGAGKTTGARQFCWRVLQETDLPRNLGLSAGTIPVLLRLRELTPHHLGRGLESFISDRVAAPPLSPDRAQPERAQPALDLLARRGVLWVFDGLDEVVNENARVYVSDWIKQMRAERPEDFFLVTSRYQGYQGRVDLGPAFCQFHVKPLNEGQVAEFVAHWYRAVLQKLRGTDVDIRSEAEEKIGSLMALLRREEYRVGRLRNLPANPLMLTILCVVHHRNLKLPKHQAALYAECVRVLVEHWHEEVRRQQGIGDADPEAAEAVLAAVAWWLHEQEGRTTQTVEELGAVATKALADLAPGAGLGRDGVDFVKRMRDESGILAMWNAGQCGFLHLTFQEYLAGLHAAREGKADELVKQVGKSWWREATLVAAAVGSREFAHKFFTALVQGDAVSKDGPFVDQCLDEARYAVLEPFLAALQAKDVQPERQLDLLRRLKPFDHPDLVAACRALAGAPHAELASLAREILQRAGVALERPAIEVLGAPFEQFVDARTRIAFIAIPAGEFEMGTAQGGYGDERPVHPVRTSKPFLLGKYPVTNAEYERFLKAQSGAQVPKYWNNSQFNDPQQPVVGVSWEDAQAFCEWAGCRLPTEAEWEYVCRAGNQGRYCFGDEEAILGDYAWFGQNSGGKSHPVGQKKPNAFGLYDVHGNVWEWCQDWKGPYPTGAVTDPTGPAEGQYRVLRGGAWDCTGEYCRSAFRYAWHPSSRGNRIGFRVVLAPRSRERGKGEGRMENGEGSGAREAGSSRSLGGGRASRGGC